MQTITITQLSEDINFQQFVNDLSYVKDLETVLLICGDNVKRYITKTLQKSIPTIKTIKGFNLVFNRVDNYGNMIEYPSIVYNNELFELSSFDSWDLPTIYKNKNNSIVLEIEPNFKDNKRRFKEVNIIDFN